MKVGAKVFVVKLHTTGELLEVGALCKVRVGGITLRCPREELRAIDDSQQKPKRSSTRKKLPTPKRERDFYREHVLDLHGLSRADATTQIEAFINETVLVGGHEAVIIHGRGRGMLREATHAYLSKCDVVASFSEDSFNPGITRVYLHSR